MDGAFAIFLIEHSFRRCVSDACKRLISSLSLLLSFVVSVGIGMGASISYPLPAHAAGDVWIDADPGCGGRFYADVDDCWALFHALALGGSRVAGVSTVFGNVSADDAARSGRDWVKRLSAAYPAMAVQRVFAGRAAPVSAGPQNAADAMSEAEKALGAFLDAAAPRQASLLMLGPVSNLAAVLQQRPARAQSIGRIIMLGGQPAGQSHWLPVNGRLRMRDYNVIKDVHAMRVLLDAEVPIDFVPVQAAFGHWLTADALSPKLADQAALLWLNTESRAWERFWRWGFGTPGYPPFDLLASALLFQADVMACEPVNARMAAFASLTGRQTGLELRAMSFGQAEAAAPLYHRCALRTGSSVDLIQAAIESARRANR